MTEILNLARELGTAIQHSEEYIDYRICEQNVECNKELQGVIETFNLKKTEINGELAKENPSQEKIDKLNTEIGDLYRKITSDETMQKFNESKQRFDQCLSEISYIINESAKGMDPYKVVIPESGGCSGSCSTCGGCN